MKTNVQHEPMPHVPAMLSPDWALGDFESDFDFDSRVPGYDAHNNYLLAGLSNLVYLEESEIEAQVKIWRQRDPGLTVKICDKGDLRYMFLYNRQFAILVFRGTVKSILWNWIRDLQYLGVRCNEHKGYIHTGFYKAALELKADLEDDYKEIFQEGQKLYITGHSLGGVLAVLTPVVSSAFDKFTHVTTFGQPRFGDLELRQSLTSIFKDRYFRVVNKGDGFAQSIGFLLIGSPVYVHSYHIGEFYIECEGGTYDAIFKFADKPENVEPDPELMSLLAAEASREQTSLELSDAGAGVIPDFIKVHLMEVYFRNASRNRFVSPFYQKDNTVWGKPLTGNTNGSWVRANLLPSRNVEKIIVQVREQNWYGLVNFRFGIPVPGTDLVEFSTWACANQNGEIRSIEINPGKVTDVMVREQSWYGIVNFGVTIDGKEMWITGNTNGEVRSEQIKQGQLSGFQWREQNRYGLIDLRIREGMDHLPWGNWLANDQSAESKLPLFIPANCSLIGIDGVEQDGYGLVNLRLNFETAAGFNETTGWVTQNFSGKVVTLRGLPIDIQGVAVKDDFSKGLVNLGVVIGNQVRWLTKEEGAHEILALTAPQLTGIQCRERAGSGIVDIRAWSNRF